MKSLALQLLNAPLCSATGLFTVCHDIGWKCTGLSVEVNTQLCELPVGTRETKTNTNTCKHQRGGAKSEETYRRLDRNNKKFKCILQILETFTG